jgi:hypothetical protein
VTIIKDLASGEFSAQEKALADLRRLRAWGKDHKVSCESYPYLVELGSKLCSFGLESQEPAVWFHWWAFLGEKKADGIVTRGLVLDTWDQFSVAIKAARGELLAALNLLRSYIRFLDADIALVAGAREAGNRNAWHDEVVKLLLAIHATDRADPAYDRHVRGLFGLASLYRVCFIEKAENQVTDVEVAFQDQLSAFEKALNCQGRDLLDPSVLFADHAAQDVAESRERLARIFLYLFSKVDEEKRIPMTDFCRACASKKDDAACEMVSRLLRFQGRVPGNAYDALLQSYIIAPFGDWTSGARRSDYDLQTLPAPRGGDFYVAMLGARMVGKSHFIYAAKYDKLLELTHVESAGFDAIYQRGEEIPDGEDRATQGFGLTRGETPVDRAARARVVDVGGELVERQDKDLKNFLNHREPSALIFVFDGKTLCDPTLIETTYSGWLNLLKNLGKSRWKAVPVYFVINKRDQIEKEYRDTPDAFDRDIASFSEMLGAGALIDDRGRTFFTSRDVRLKDFADFRQFLLEQRGPAACPAYQDRLLRDAEYLKECISVVLQRDLGNISIVYTFSLYSGEPRKTRSVRALWSDLLKIIQDKTLKSRRRKLVSIGIAKLRLQRKQAKGYASALANVSDPGALNLNPLVNGAAAFTLDAFNGMIDALKANANNQKTRLEELQTRLPKLLQETCVEMGIPSKFYGTDFFEEIIEVSVRKKLAVLSDYNDETEAARPLIEARVAAALGELGISDDVIKSKVPLFVNELLVPTKYDSTRPVGSADDVYGLVSTGCWICDAQLLGVFKKAFQDGTLRADASISGSSSNFNLNLNGLLQSGNGEMDIEESKMRLLNFLQLTKGYRPRYPSQGICRRSAEAYDPYRERIFGPVRLEDEAIMQTLMKFAVDIRHDMFEIKELTEKMDGMLRAAIGVLCIQTCKKQGLDLTEKDNMPNGLSNLLEQITKLRMALQENYKRKWILGSKKVDPQAVTDLSTQISSVGLASPDKIHWEDREFFENLTLSLDIIHGAVARLENPKPTADRWKEYLELVQGVGRPLTLNVSTQIRTYLFDHESYIEKRMKVAFLDRIRYLRESGWFADAAGLTELELIATSDEYGGGFKKKAIAFRDRVGDWENVFCQVLESVLGPT